MVSHLAIKSTSQDTLEIMLYILPLDIFIRNMAAKSSLVLNVSAEIKQEDVRYKLERDGQFCFGLRDRLFIGKIK